jgi:hypothetical protein
MQRIFTLVFVLLVGVEESGGAKLAASRGSNGQMNPSVERKLLCRSGVIFSVGGTTSPAGLEILSAESV